MSLRIGIGGIGGRMGQEIAAAALADPAFELVGGVEISPASIDSLGSKLAIVESAAALLPRIDVLIDFTTPEATAAHADACAAAHVPFVSGVTGLSSPQVEHLREASQSIPVFYARNMSIGLNALLAVLPQLTRALSGYDIELTELHHRHKKDAPSGTALALAEVIASALEANLGDRATYGRIGIAPRQPGEIGIHALRGGGNAGEHTVLFADEGEEIRVSHHALSRRTFALGALRAALFVSHQTPGLYTMANLISV